MMVGRSDGALIIYTWHELLTKYRGIVFMSASA